jgi:hypothetical protein
MDALRLIRARHAYCLHHHDGRVDGLELFVGRYTLS